MFRSNSKSNSRHQSIESNNNIDDGAILMKCTPRALTLDNDDPITITHNKDDFIKI